MCEDERLAERGSWGRWSEFLFAYMGSMIGYGNIWRFPYVCYRNGGGAFLLPFLAALVFLGLPMTFLEILYSQYSNYGPGRVWEVCPLFKGIGLCMMVIIFFTSVYYTMIMAWTAYYLVHSFSVSIPWSTCDNEWNTENCTLFLHDSIREVTGSNSSEANVTTTGKLNVTAVSAAEEFWFNKALDVTPSIEELGSIQWPLVLCLLAAWLITFLCLIKGIKSLGKVAYVAASLPFVILTILLIRGCMLPGSGSGLYYFLVPRFHLLGSLTVWRDAATQMFYSVSLGCGLTSTLASYNKFHNNCYRDALVMPLLDTFTSLYAGLVTFAYLGYMAHISGKVMDQVVKQGSGLIFIAYPIALMTLPLPQLWSVLLFLMLFTMVCPYRGLTTAIVDLLPHLLPRKLLIMMSLCVVLFLLGLPLTAQGGVYVLTLTDWYLASVALLASAGSEVTVLAWCYGTDRLYSDIEHMIGYRPSSLFKYAWKFVTPGILLVLWISGFVYFQSISTKLPGFNQASDIGGVVLAICPLLCIPAVAAWQLATTDGTLSQRIKKRCTPTSLWRPAVYKGVGGAHNNGADSSVV